MFNTTSKPSSILFSGGSTTAIPAVGTAIRLPQSRAIKFVDTNSNFPTPTILVKLSTKYVASNGRDYGADLSVTCSATQCRSPTAGNVLTTSSDTTKYLDVESNPDGSVTIPGEKCTWEMKCTKPGDMIEISNFVARMHSTTVLSIFDNRPVSKTVMTGAIGVDFGGPRLLRQFTGKTHQSLSLLVLPTNHASIVFDVSGGSENSFSLRFRCVQSASCVSQGAPRPLLAQYSMSTEISTARSRATLMAH